MSEPRYDAATLARVSAVAARLQSERDSRNSGGASSTFTAEEMDVMAAEVGIDPALMRQALGQVLASRQAQARHRRQTLLAVAACVLFLGAGSIFGYKLFLNAQTLRAAASPADVVTVPGLNIFPPPARVSQPPAVPVLGIQPPDQNTPLARANQQYADMELRRRDREELYRAVSTELAAYRHRNYAMLISLYSPNYVMRARNGRTYNYRETDQILRQLPDYPRSWSRSGYAEKVEAEGNSGRATVKAYVRYTDNAGNTQRQEFKLEQTWVRQEGSWRKLEDREL